MTEKELISWVKYLYQKDRNVLLMALKDCGNFHSKFDSLASLIKKSTGQPQQNRCWLDEDTLDWLKLTEVEQNKKENIPRRDQIGDACYFINILLNEGVKRYYDDEIKLIDKCGGTAISLELYINILLPLYTYEIIFTKYNKNDDSYEFGPYQLKLDFEKSVLNIIKNIMKEEGYFYLTPKLSIRKITNVYTDLNSVGKVTLFDCLFTDTHDYTNHIFRVNNSLIKTHGNHLDFSWREKYDEKHKLVEKQIYIHFPSKDTETISFDSKGHIKNVEIDRHDVRYSNSRFQMDIEKALKRRLKTAKKK